MQKGKSVQRHYVKMNIKNGRMEITTVMGCKMDCRYCPQKLLLKQYFAPSRSSNYKRIMSLDDFKFFLDKLGADILICFAGMSEPWQNPECTDMLMYAYGKGYPLAVYTTLMGFTLSDFERIKDIPFEEFVVHLPDQQDNSNIRITDEYLEVLSYIANYKRANVSLVTDYSCHGEINSRIKNILPSNIINQTELNDRAGNLNDNHISKMKEIKGQILCYRCKDRLNSNVLLPDGSVLLCCMDYSMRHVLGNLFESSYENILNSQVANYIRREMKDDTNPILCRKCVNAMDIYKTYDYFYEYYNWAISLYKEYVR